MKNIEKDDECGQNNISFNIVTAHSQFIHSHEDGGGSMDTIGVFLGLGW